MADLTESGFATVTDSEARELAAEDSTAGQSAALDEAVAFESVSSNVASHWLEGQFARRPMCLASNANRAAQTGHVNEIFGMTDVNKEGDIPGRIACKIDRV